MAPIVELVKKPDLIYIVDSKFMNRVEKHYGVDYEPLELKKRIDGHFPA